MKCVFVSHCILAQTVKAKPKSGVIREVVDFLMDHDINIMQMPCPETLFLGVDRDTHGKKWYESKGFREKCKEIASSQVEYMNQLKKAGREIVGIIGVEFSPACSTITDSSSRYRQEGIYMEELKKSMKLVNINVPFISVHSGWKNKMKEELEKLIT